MTEAEADALLATLTAAGVTAEYVAYYLPDGQLIPDGVEFWALAPGCWDCEFVPTWVVLPPSHPAAATVDAARDRFFADKQFAEGLADAFGRQLDRQYEADHRDLDW